MATAQWSASKNAKLCSPTAGFGVDVQSLHRTADLGSLMATFETLVSQWLGCGTLITKLQKLKTTFCVIK